MTNLEKYTGIFQSAFETEGAVENFCFGSTPEWDSIGHMCLITALEDAFEVEFEPEEIVKVSSYAEGIEVLKKKGIDF